ncbi:MAG: hypothetical protein DRI54_01020 [Bacteroidetes bacterium]|nr:MAG: hypothetical protein DRI54_01020 [Bacteroidota bacterium]
MKNIVQIILILVVSVASLQVNAQRKKEQINNLPDFDRQFYHFGFVLSLNTSSLIIDFKDIRSFEDSVLSVDLQGQGGFNLGMLASLDMSGNWHLRFIPTLSFNERILEYTLLLENGSTETIKKNVSSTNIDFPLLFKYRTNRMNNIALYALLGGQFSLDVASQKDVNNDNAQEVIIKLDNTNYSASGGLGIDFFLPYFKFGIELKANIGLKNLLIDDNTNFSAPLESLRSNSIVLSFTFEG